MVNSITARREIRGNNGQDELVTNTLLTTLNDVSKAKVTSRTDAMYNEHQMINLLRFS